MKGRRIFLKSFRTSLFNEDLSNEPNFGRIHLAGQYLYVTVSSYSISIQKRTVATNSVIEMNSVPKGNNGEDEHGKCTIFVKYNMQKNIF